MLKSEQLPAGLLVFFFIFYGWFVINELTPPSIVSTSSNKQVFSAQRALNYLRQIAEEPHSGGTKAHDAVFSYIIDFCEQRGLETIKQQDIGISYVNGGVVGGLAKNIIVKIKGVHSTGSVLVMGHYDSHPNTFGASDNGAAVAAMMETIDILIKGPKLNNDLIFLFTDLEESGQLGADAFIHNYKDLSKIKVVFNFDARGNSGLNYTFETSTNNGWVIREFAKSADRPIANSFAYEVYKRMPNHTDFSPLKKLGIAGLNTAFIDGYAYYHGMRDTPENLDIRSFQSEGDLMLSLARNFASKDLTHIKDTDAIFFNPVGHWLWIYAMSWDYPLIGITLLLFITVIVVGNKKDLINFGQVMKSTGLYLLSVVLIFGLTWLLQWSVLKIYSHYTNFSGYNSYHIKLYLIAIFGLVLLVYTYLFGLKIKGNSNSLMVGSLFLLVLLMIFIKLVLPSAAYIIYVPLIPFLVVFILLMLTNTTYKDHPFKFVAGQIISLILPIGLWAPFIYILYVVFGISLPYPAILFLCLLFPVLIPSLQIFSFIKPKFLLTFSLGMVLSGLALAHFNSGYSEQNPLPTQLIYALNQDTRQAVWVSRQKVKDEWISKYIPGTQKSRFIEFYPDANFLVWRNKARFIDFDLIKYSITSDTIISGKRKMKLLIHGALNINSFDLSLPENIRLITVSNRLIKTTEVVRELSFYSIPKEGVEIGLDIEGNHPFELALIQRIIGLPTMLLIHELPKTMSYAPGYMSNTTQIKEVLNIPAL